MVSLQAEFNNKDINTIAQSYITQSPVGRMSQAKEKRGECCEKKRGEERGRKDTTRVASLVSQAFLSVPLRCDNTNLLSGYSSYLSISHSHVVFAIDHSAFSFNDNVLLFSIGIKFFSAFYTGLSTFHSHQFTN